MVAAACVHARICRTLPARFIRHAACQQVLFTTCECTIQRISEKHTKGINQNSLHKQKYSTQQFHDLQKGTKARRSYGDEVSDVLLWNGQTFQLVQPQQNVLCEEGITQVRMKLFSCRVLSFERPTLIFTIVFKLVSSQVTIEHPTTDHCHFQSVAKSSPRTCSRADIDQDGVEGSGYKRFKKALQSQNLAVECLQHFLRPCSPEPIQRWEHNLRVMQVILLTFKQ